MESAIVDLGGRQLRYQRFYISQHGHAAYPANKPPFSVRADAEPKMSFSEDDCTRQRGLKAVVQSSIERTVSGVRCTNDDLKPVLVALATDQPLDVRYRDHDLSGDWAGYRECHIKPDLLLIYRKSDADTLRLARLGSHSELFG